MSPSFSTFSWEYLAVLLLLLLSPLLSSAAWTCAEGYSCYEDKATGIVWTMLLSGNLYGPTCSQVCNTGLCGGGTFYGCQSQTAVLRGAAFAPIAAGLGFNCTTGGCWGSNSSRAQMWVSRGPSNTTTRKCYFPQEAVYSCTETPGNANCFGERYSNVCPCTVQPLDQTCKHPSPPVYPEVATWPANMSKGTSCLERINYWRKVACDEGWPECPPCGLPPMSEVVGCHQCANSEAEYDSKNGAHKSFTRCGELAQGEGGGSSCAAVIDSFVKERQVFPDSNGTVVCRGHCGPIVAAGCRSFFWGKAQSSNLYTLNWNAYNIDKCNAYCANPTDNGCFLHNNLSPDVGYVYPLSANAKNVELGVGALLVALLLARM